MLSATGLPFIPELLNGVPELVHLQHIWEITWLKPTPTSLKLFDRKTLIEKASYLVLEPSEGSPPPQDSSHQTEHSKLFFVFPENTKAMISHWPPFLFNPFLTEYLPFKAVLLHCFYEPLPQSIRTSFSLKPTLLFLLEILLLQSCLFGESGPLKSSFWPHLEEADAFMAGSWPVLRLQGTKFPREPRRVLGLASSQSSPCLKTRVF